MRWAVALLVILALGFLIFPRASGTTIELYYSSTCGCCIEYGKYLQAEGFNVVYKQTPNMDAVKKAARVPEPLQSCHTARIGTYIVEGHVPAEVINKLLEEQPDVSIVALPGMPSGSPGMPGQKTEQFVIYAVKDGEVFEYVRV